MLEGRQYLIVREAAHIEPASGIFGERRKCITAQMALNGSRNDLDGADVLLWITPDLEEVMQSRPLDRSLGMELAPDCARVRIIDMTNPTANMYTPEECAKHGTTYESLTTWAVEVGAIIKVPKPPEQTDELESTNGESEQEAPSSLGRDPQTALPSDSPPINAGSPKAPDDPSSSPLGGRDSGEPAPFPEPLPDSFYDEEPRLRLVQPFPVESKPSHWQRPDNRPSEPLEWPVPTDFWADPTPPEMRSKWMPPALADYFSHEAETWGADPGIFWGFGVGICAGAMSDAIKINVKPSAPSYVQSARLHIGIAGDPGDMKSPILTALVRPFGQLEDRLMEEAAKAIEKYADDHEAYEILRKKYVSAKVDGKSTDRPIAPERPCRNRLMVKGSTIEGLRTVLQDQGDRGILEVHDELISIFTGANQYKKGGDDLQKRLQLWDGGPTTFDLAGQHVRIKNWSTSIIGGTQPAKLRRTIAKMGLAEDGTLQRFNIYLTRHATLDLERPEHPGNAEFADIVERLYWMQHQGAVKYSPEADVIRRDFRIWTHEQGQRPWMDGSLKQHLAKHTNFFARFCLTYHAIESAAQHSAYIQPIIQPETAQRVADLFQQCLYPHAEAFYGQIMDGSNEFIKEVRYLAEKLLAKNPREIDLTWITHGWTKWRTFKPWEKKNILTVLTEAGWLRSKDPRGFIDGAPYRASVNPALQTLFAEYVGPIRGRLEEMEERRQGKMGD